MRTALALLSLLLAAPVLADRRLLCHVVADGRDVGDVLVAEGHAREYDGGTRQPWCE